MRTIEVDLDIHLITARRVSDCFIFRFFRSVLSTHALRTNIGNPGMAAYIFCLTTSGGVPIFARNKIGLKSVKSKLFLIEILVKT